MMKAAAVLFGLGALGGLTMLVIRLRGADRPPSIITMIHGVLAAAGLTLLIYGLCTIGMPAMVKASIFVLLLASAVGMWVNLRFHSQLLPLPVGPIFVHAGFAVVGFALLLLAIVNYAQPTGL